MEDVLRVRRPTALCAPCSEHFATARLYHVTQSASSKTAAHVTRHHGCGALLRLPTACCSGVEPDLSNLARDGGSWSFGDSGHNTADDLKHSGRGCDWNCDAMATPKEVHTTIPAALHGASQLWQERGRAVHRSLSWHAVPLPEYPT